MYISYRPTIDKWNKGLNRKKMFYYDQPRHRVNAYIQWWKSDDDHKLRDYIFEHILWMEINAYDYGFILPSPNL